MSTSSTRRDLLKGSLALAGLGMLGIPDWALPVLAARAAADAGGSALAGAGAAAGGVTVGFVLVVLWLWQRDKLQDVLQASVDRPRGAAS